MSEDSEFQAIFARALAEVGDSEETRNAMLYLASICPCPCHKTGDRHDCPTKFCTYGSNLCASHMNARLNHHGSGGGVFVVPTPPDPPNCCGEEPTLIGSGHSAGFDIGVWRCLICEGHERTCVRTDGQNFWVGAMGRAIRNEELRIIADAYRERPASHPDSSPGTRPYWAPLPEGKRMTTLRKIFDIVWRWGLLLLILYAVISLLFFSGDYDPLGSCQRDGDCQPG